MADPELLAAEFAEAFAVADAADAEAAARGPRGPRALRGGPVRAESAPAQLTDRARKVLARQLLMANSGTDGFYTHALAYADDDNLANWVVLFAGLSGPAAGGEFLFELNAPNDFPAAPPSVTCHTANGVFEVGGRICVSIGEFHPGAWRAALGMSGFARELAVTLELPGEVSSGISVVSESQRSDATRRGLAALSVASNATARGILARALARFEAAAADPAWLPESAAANAIRRRLGVPTTK